jgi:hypothetical protein
VRNISIPSCMNELMQCRWIDAQVTLTSKVLDQIPDREKLEARFTQTTDYAKVMPALAGIVSKL